MIHFLTFSSLASIDLGKPSPKPTSFVGDQMEASVELWASSDGLLKIGVWECTPGRFTASREMTSETCHIIAGRVSLHGSDGYTRELAAGQMLILPMGWRGEWTVRRPRGSSTSFTRNRAQKHHNYIEGDASITGYALRERGAAECPLEPSVYQTRTVRSRPPSCLAATRPMHEPAPREGRQSLGVHSRKLKSRHGVADIPESLLADGGPSKQTFLRRAKRSAKI